MSTPAIVDNNLGAEGLVIVELIDVHTGDKRVVEQHNAITTGLLETIVDWVRGTSPAVPDYIALASGAVTLNDSTTQDSELTLTDAVAGAGQQLAQGIQVSAEYTIGSVLLYMKRVGASPGNVYAEIQTDSSGSPSGTAVSGGVSSTVAINGIDSLGFEWIRFVFPGNPVLAATTQYHLVLKSNGYTYDSGNVEVQWGTDESTPGYSGGAAATYNGSLWSAASPAADACFRVIRKADAAMTDVEGEVIRNQISSKVEQSSTTVRMVAVFGISEGVGRHNMVGLFNDSSAGTLCAVANIDLEKTNHEVMNIYWIWKFVAG